MMAIPARDRVRAVGRRAVLKQNPASRPGLSLPERYCLASTVVFGDDRTRTPQVEAIVQAGAHDVAPEACPRDGSTDGKGRASEIEALQRAEAIGNTDIRP